MGEHVDIVNSYFAEAVSSGRTRFAVDNNSERQPKAYHSHRVARSPIGFIGGTINRQENNLNVELLYDNLSYSGLRNWEVEFLADLEELHDYYGILSLSGYPVSFSDFRLAACLTAIKYDGQGEINLPGGQSFSVTCE